MDIAINYFAVIAAAVASIVLGSLWYGPVFGKMWMKEMGFPEGHVMKPSGNMARSYGLMALGPLVMAYVLAHSIAFARLAGEMSDLNAGLQGGFWNWLGFVMPVTLGIVLWEGKSWKLFGINAGYYLVSLPIMGVILAMWS